MSDEMTHGRPAHSLSAPDTEVDVRQTFGINIDLIVPAFSCSPQFPASFPAISARARTAA